MKGTIIVRRATRYVQHVWWWFALWMAFLGTMLGGCGDVSYPAIYNWANDACKARGVQLLRHDHHATWGNRWKVVAYCTERTTVQGSVVIPAGSD